MKTTLTILFFFLLSICKMDAQVAKSYPLEFAYGNSELDTFIMENFRIPFIADWGGFKTSFPVKFTVDSLGNIINFCCNGKSDVDMQRARENYPGALDSVRLQYKQEAERVIMFSKGLWARAEDNGNYVNAEFSKKILIGAGKKPKDYEDYMMYTPTVVSDSAIFFYNLGVKKMSQKKYLIAIKYLETAIMYNNGLVDAYYNLGVSNLQVKAIKKACKWWGIAVSLGDTESTNLIEKYCKN